MAALWIASTGCDSRGPTDSVAIEAHDFLTLPVSVQILSVNGKKPSGEALSLLSRRLQENAQGVSSITTHDVIADAHHFWTEGALTILEREHEPSPLPPSTLVVLCVPGFLEESQGAGGVTFGPHSVAIFPDALGPSQEPCALLHELGHILGLVKNRSHEDPTSPHHDVDMKCVMFRAVTGAQDFCFFCKTDLESARRR